MYPRIDHIQITVKNFVRAVAFYDQLMPILGFDLSKKGGGRVDAHDFDVVEYVHDNIVVGINSPEKGLKMKMFIAENLERCTTWRFGLPLPRRWTKFIQKLPPSPVC
jgi:catechol 2,3-dioxygenase-like lactoylglutathione lyase family enzyme